MTMVSITVKPEDMDNLPLILKVNQITMHKLEKLLQTIIIIFYWKVLRFKNYITESTDGGGSNMQKFPLETD